MVHGLVLRSNFSFFFLEVHDYKARSSYDEFQTTCLDVFMSHRGWIEQ